MELSGKTIVVTGGGSGIGRALCKQLVEKDSRVIALDIDEKGLRETGTSLPMRQYQWHLVDISNQEKVEGLVRTLLEKGDIDGLINNAGIIQPFVDVIDLDYAKIHQVMDVNFYGTLYLTKALLPHFISRPEAHIVNVASMGAFIPFPGQSIYGASKAAVKLLTEGLYAELMDTQVGVSLSMPGAVKTNITANSGLDMPNGGNDSAKVPMLSAEEAAAGIIQAIEKRTFRIVQGKDARFMDFINRLRPTWSIGFIVKKMGEFRKKKS